MAEGDELDALVSAEADWSKPTPAAGWTIAHQVAHLAAADANVLIAIRTRWSSTGVRRGAGAGRRRRSRRRRGSGRTAGGTAGTLARRSNGSSGGAPADPFRVELTGPDGETWVWGPEDARQRVQGSAVDFCLRVTRRRARAEIDLTAIGEDAQKWLDIARVFL